MSAYNNRHYIAGNLGSDPMEFDAGGNTLVKFNVAVKRSSKSEITDWIPCTAWHDLARGIKAHIVKGDAVMVWGSFHVDSKKNDDGSYSKFYTLNVDTIGKQVFGVKKENGGEAGEEDPF
jgi:single-strand DNA-binding protein